MKKLATIVLALVLVFSVSACGSKKADTDKSGTETTDSKKDDTKKAAVSWKTQVYKDEYLSYEIPDTWSKDTENSQDANKITLLTVTDKATDTPTNVVVQILNTSNQSADADFSDKATQESFHQYLLSTLKGSLGDLQNEKFSTYEVNGKYVYVMAYDVAQTDGSTMTQTAYIPMGLKYSLILYATDFADGVTPDVNEVATHIVETLTIL